MDRTDGKELGELKPTHESGLADEIRSLSIGLRALVTFVLIGGLLVALFLVYEVLT